MLQNYNLKYVLSSYFFNYFSSPKISYCVSIGKNMYNFRFNPIKT